jgi:dipeptidyl-peptidase-4
VPVTAPASRAQLSPDGSSVTYASAGDLYVGDVRTAVSRRLTDDARPGVFNGLPEFIASEELGRLRGAWWSADSQAIAFAHVDERGVPPITIRHAVGHAPVDEVHRYPFPGGPNAVVTLRVTSARGGTPREVDLGMQPEDYLARVIPHPDGGWLAAVLPRDQRSLHWHRVAPDGSAHAIWIEASDPWINLDDDTDVLPDGRILRSSERSGFRHLELRAADGRWNEPSRVHGWSPMVASRVTARGAVSANRDGVLERHLYAVPYDTARRLMSLGG